MFEEVLIRSCEGFPGHYFGMTTTSESNPGAMATSADDVPGGPKTLTSKVIGCAAGMVQDLTPVKQFQQVLSRPCLLSCVIFLYMAAS